MLTTRQRADRYRRQNARTGRDRMTARQMRQLCRMAGRRSDPPRAVLAVPAADLAVPDEVDDGMWCCGGNDCAGQCGEVAS